MIITLRQLFIFMIMTITLIITISATFEYYYDLIITDKFQLFTRDEIGCCPQHLTTWRSVPTSPTLAYLNAGLMLNKQQTVKPFSL